jgi:acyl-homoserine lactone synthase
MIHIVTATKRCVFEDEFLELRQIDCANSVHMAVRKADGLANGIDPFDDDDAIRLLALEDGRVYGLSRPTLTSKPHRLGDGFPHLATPRGGPRDLAAYERAPALANPMLIPKDPRPSITREITL